MTNECIKCSKGLKRKRITGMCLKCLRKEPKTIAWKENRSQNMVGNQHAKGLKYKKEGEYLQDKNRLIRQSPEYKEWRTSVFERDNYECVVGGKEHGDKLNADHIKPFATYIDLRFNIDNGRTLCIPCHRATPTFGKKIKIEV